MAGIEGGHLVHVAVTRVPDASMQASVLEMAKACSVVPCKALGARAGAFPGLGRSDGSR